MKMKKEWSKLEGRRWIREKKSIYQRAVVRYDNTKDEMVKISFSVKPD